MTWGVLRGNGNRAVWKVVTIHDGAVYRLPSGELVRASVEPHPDGLPEYWVDVPSENDSWSVGKDLTLSVLWPEPRAREPGSVGPARVKFLTAACVGMVPWALGYYVDGMNMIPEILREMKEDDGESHRTGCTVADLEEVPVDEAMEFTWAASRASLSWKRMVGTG